MDYLLISDFHPLSSPSNAVWKLNFSNSPSTPLLCCPHSDWFITYIHTYLKFDSLHLQSKVKWCSTIKARLQKKECQRLFIKVNLKFLFKDGSVSCHPNVTRQTVPFCRSREREGTFTNFVCIWVSSRRCCFIVSAMTYNVSSGTLNTTIPIPLLNTDEVNDSLRLTGSPVQRDMLGIVTLVHKQT